MEGDKRLEQLWKGVAVNENTPELLAAFYRFRLPRQAPVGLESPQSGPSRCLDSRADTARGCATHQAGPLTAGEGPSQQQPEATALLLQEHPVVRGRAGKVRPEFRSSHRTAVAGHRPDKLAAGQDGDQHPARRCHPERAGPATDVDAAAPCGQQQFSQPPAMRCWNAPYRFCQPSGSPISWETASPLCKNGLSS